MRKRIFIVTTLLLLAAGTAQATRAELISLQSREGVQQTFILLEPDNPRAAVILFAGGKGALDLRDGLFGGVQIGWGKNNFLVRMREQFAAHGLMVAVVDAPSDHQDKDGMYLGFRSSDEHVQDIDTVIAHLRQLADIPVWLVGTSRGTESAAHVAIHSQQRPDGLVLTSSMSEYNNKGDAVTGMPLDRIRIPTLIVAHAQDGCRVTPPTGGENIRSALSNASVAELTYFSGGREEGRPCGAMSHHGFLGIEHDVVDHIATFIKSH